MPSQVPERMNGKNVQLYKGFLVVDPVELRGLGLGTYLFTQVVLWAKQIAPHGDVQPIPLYAQQAEDEKARDRRNGFYEKFGLTFGYRAVKGVERAEGSSLPMKVSDLQVPEAFPQIEKLSLAEFLQDHFKELRKEREHTSREVQYNERLFAEYKALRQDTNLIVRLGRWINRIGGQRRR